MMRKASVDATTMAALELRPEPAGTDPMTRRSNPMGLLSPALKKWCKTPCKSHQNIAQCVSRDQVYVVSRLDITLPSELGLVNIHVPAARGVPDRCKGLPVILSVGILCDYVACIVAMPRSAGDEDIALDRGGEDPEKGIVDVFTCESVECVRWVLTTCPPIRLMRPGARAMYICCAKCEHARETATVR